MAENIRSVSIGELVVSKSPDDVLVAYGLGSCVAVAFYDPVSRIAGMLHALLPSAAGKTADSNTPAKFVDQGVPLLIDHVLKMGANRNRLIVKLCGGAQMLTAPGFSNTLNIGERNVSAAQTLLAEAGFKIQSQDVGGNSGRTVKLAVVNGQVTVRSLGQKERILE